MYLRMVVNYESWSHDLLIQIEIEVHTHHNHTSTQQSHSMRSLGEQLRPDSGGDTPRARQPPDSGGESPRARKPSIVPTSQCEH